VRLNNQSQAYREVFQPARMDSRSVWTEACRMAGRIDVSMRIDWLRAQSLERSQISVMSLMRDLYEIATADPAELTRMLVVNCRHCHGERFGYQWVDVDEFTAACAEHERKWQGAKLEARPPMPTCDGGFAHDTHADPHAMCPHCLGLGRREVLVADTTNLSAKGRKLFKGVKLKSDGSIEILMHDQIAARDQLHKLAGAYKTDSNGGALSPPIAQPGDAPKGDASVTYLAMVHGDRKRA
jgi:hypothetical protein